MLEIGIDKHKPSSVIDILLECAAKFRAADQFRNPDSRLLELRHVIRSPKYRGP